MQSVWSGPTSCPLGNSMDEHWKCPTQARAMCARDSVGSLFARVEQDPVQPKCMLDHHGDDDDDDDDDAYRRLLSRRGPGGGRRLLRHDSRRLKKDEYGPEYGCNYRFESQSSPEGWAKSSKRTVTGHGKFGPWCAPDNRGGSKRCQVQAECEFV